MHKHWLSDSPTNLLMNFFHSMSMHNITNIQFSLNSWQSNTKFLVQRIFHNGKGSISSYERYYTQTANFLTWRHSKWEPAISSCVSDDLQWIWRCYVRAENSKFIFVVGTYILLLECVLTVWLLLRACKMRDSWFWIRRN